MLSVTAGRERNLMASHVPLGPAYGLEAEVGIESHECNGGGRAACSIGDIGPDHQREVLLRQPERDGASSSDVALSQKTVSTALAEQACLIRAYRLTPVVYHIHASVMGTVLAQRVRGH